MSEFQGRRLWMTWGAYKHSSIRRLIGPAQDVQKMHSLLIGGGYGFPEMFADWSSRRRPGAQFREAFQKALIERASKGAVLVVYFAGHGTQIDHDNEDEPDRLDEALMLVDSDPRFPHACDVRAARQAAADSKVCKLEPWRSARG